MFLTESGSTWDEPLPLYRKGQININFYQNMIGYTAGDVVAGTVDVVINESFDSKLLKLSFVGVERCHLKLVKMANGTVPPPKDFHRDVKTIIDISVDVTTFDEVLPPGHYTFPFQLYLPSWLPESTSLKVGSEKFFVEYTVRAQFTPLTATGFVADRRFPLKYKNISLFRGSRKLYVYLKPEAAPVITFVQDIKREIGGLLGFGASSSKSEIKFEKNRFYPGEDIKITIKTDNSKCKFPIRNFKFKLYRQIVYKDAQTGDNLFIETKVFAKKEPGVAANTS